MEISGLYCLRNKVKRKIIGIKISPLNNEFNKQKLGPAKAIYYAAGETWFVTKTTLKIPGKLAASIVAIDFALSILIKGYADRLL